MVSLRTGWPRSEVLDLTLTEAQTALEEAALRDEQMELRVAEAFHAPEGLRERAQLRDRRKESPGRNLDALVRRVALGNPDLQKKLVSWDTIKAVRDKMEARRGG